MRKTLTGVLLVGALTLHGSALAKSSVQSYLIVGVSDGDTLTVFGDRKTMKIRLANIDAPEKRQPFGKVSKLSLSAICYGRAATVDVQSVDRYGRSVATVRCNGVDASRAQVERGMAWVYPKYNVDQSLPAVEMSARSAQRGLWMDAMPVAPWEFRRRR